MNKLMITRVSIRPNNTGKLPHLQSKQRRGVRNHNTSEMIQTLTHKLKHNTIQMLYNTNKHKMNNLIKYTTEEHTGYVTVHTLSASSARSRTSLTRLGFNLLGLSTSDDRTVNLYRPTKELLAALTKSGDDTSPHTPF